MFQRTDDLRITQVRPLLPPAILLEEIPISDGASNVVATTRKAIAEVLEGRDMGPVAREAIGDVIGRLVDEYTPGDYIEEWDL